MTNNEMIEYLRILGDKLAKNGMSGEIILTGGAAMCLVHSARTATQDIDALYEPKSEINRLAFEIAAENGLPTDWLNDSVKGFVGANAETEDFLCFGNLKISTVTPEYLLAMKLRSSRTEGHDIEDICFLFRKLGIRTPDEAATVIGRFFPMESILPKTGYIIEQCLDEVCLGEEPAADNDEWEM